MNKATSLQVKEHLTRCKNLFQPPLDSYVDIEKYSKKLKSKSILFERFDSINNNKLIGLIAAYDNSDVKQGFISNLSIESEFFGTKLSSNILSECINYFKIRKYNSIILEVYKENKKAINFYTKNGFIIANIDERNNDTFTMQLKLNNMKNKRDYNKEFKDNERKYFYGFDYDVMHPFMIKSFKPHFVKGNALELGSFKGLFTKRLLPFFSEIACVEASSEAITDAKKLLSDNSINFYNSIFEETNLDKKYDNIILTHVLEHIENPVKLLKKINDEWLSENGRLFLVCPNANAPSRQIAVKMGIISHNSAVTPGEKAHGHHITYSLDTLESDVKKAGLNVVHRSGIFFKALANFQWDKILGTDVISPEYLEGCYELGQQYPDLCSSIFLMCEKGN
tara:strand:+ start:332 stop:1516 length:1185 start_codon:yes stop_codon:yes gene_type:complete